MWAPSFQIYVDALEKMQRLFLKFLAYKVDGVYPVRGTLQSDLLKRFGFDSLKSRRVKALLSFLKRIIHHEVECSQLLHQLCFGILLFFPSSILLGNSSC